MDKEEARFILRCFRPDGADAENPDFAEALAWAAKDRELGDWLAHERSSDAGFANALNAVTIPLSLREEILAGLAAERGDASAVPDRFDHSIMGAMASIRPPQNLRAEILAAMDRTAAERKTRRMPWKLILPIGAAAAAAITVAVLVFSPAGNSSKQTKLVVNLPAEGGNTKLTLPPKEEEDPGSALVPISINSVEDGAIKVFENPGYTLDLRNEDHHKLFEHLKGADLPCPNACLPPGLKRAPGVGCRKLEIAGKTGALVCFEQKGDEVRLVAFKRCDVQCHVPKKGEGEPDIRMHGKWSVARWEDEDWVFVLMGGENFDAKRLESFFVSAPVEKTEK
ncbi:hypothetical protein [Haloferula sp. BvORR071]|uniref:hypothetical protein n=1 Tax=Haloferula sp. BvORR071 TaxID=1396141 RepID=UPI0005577A18|nr:hypothetical protein [Haloferula sp. BvORR071]